MFKKLLAICLVITLGFTTVACGSNNPSRNNTNFTNNTSPTATNNIPNGQYPVQQATFNDVDGEYNLMLLNTPSGSRPNFMTTDLQMARLTDEEIEAGKQTYVEINGSDAVMHLTEDFRIEYIHNETETVTNPDTGRQETVIVRQQSSFWSPFAGALAGQAIGNMLFSPQYYVPPVYQPGVTLTGFGGYGSSYSQAVDSYRSNHNTVPPVEKNRQSVRTTGTIRNSQTGVVKRTNLNNTRSTGSGVGSSNLRNNNTSNSTTRQRNNSSFGTNRNSGSTTRRTPTRRSSGSSGFRRRRR
ncbi:hypothetical protein IQ215_08690 [Cyanobacterium stanieri LEGE 03274]|uniref:DUF1190 domain-containing protein n=1 Tax=Cyanobacterium stanieri LEGE 03274 TaxID=1828756 RepID=A0ABR9V6Q0_9CHRO|nr:hypothetical protein [Cyanobacterium stanieri]MBE9222771.1 hypothetical protein [Cyanobacterium stanieri LEGE 03274]